MGIPTTSPVTVNGYPITKEFVKAVSMGLVPGYSVVHKFGAINGLTTTLTPITNGGFYRTPTSTVTLEAISTSANDTAAGTGLQQLTIEYLDSNFNVQVATMEMAGAAASTTVSGVLRLLRMYGTRSGTYATQTSFSQKGAITVREAGGGITWGTLPVESGTLGLGQSLIGCYTVPMGKRAYILSQFLSVDSNKSVNFYFMARANANDITPPYSGLLRVKNVHIGVNSFIGEEHSTLESYDEYTDLFYMGKTSTGTASASAEFEMLIEDI